MPPRRKLTPSYLPHKQSGRGRAVWYDKAGNRQQRLLPGPFESAESRKAFGKLLLEEEIKPRGASIPPEDRDGLLLVELLDAYHQHASGITAGPTVRRPPNSASTTSSFGRCTSCTARRWPRSLGR